MAIGNDLPKTNDYKPGLFSMDRYASMLGPNGSFASNPTGFLDWFDTRYGPNRPAASSQSAQQLSSASNPWANANNFGNYQKMLDDVFNQSGFQRATGEKDYSKLNYYNPSTQQTVTRDNPFYQYNQTYQYWQPAGKTLAEMQNPTPAPPANMPTDVAGLLSYIDSGGDPNALGLQQMFRIAMGENQKMGESGKARVAQDYDTLAKAQAQGVASRGLYGSTAYDMAKQSAQAGKQQAMLDIDEAIRSANVGRVGDYATDVATRLENAQKANRDANESAANRQFQLDLAQAGVPVELFNLLANLESQRINTNANTTGQHLATMNSFNFGYPTGFPEMMQNYGAGTAAENLYGDARGQNGFLMGLLGLPGSILSGFTGGYGARY